MKHTYDWSKLDARWQFDGANSLIDRKWDCYYSVKELESGAAVRGKIGTNVPAALDQLAQCRVEPRAKYDWSKLDAGWRFEPKRAGIRADALVHTTDTGTDRHFAIEELEQGSFPSGLHTNYWRMLWPFALDQLAKCRIYAPDVATVTELRPRDEYDWSRLEGSGWKAYTGNDVHSMLESERWNYYVGTGFLAFRLYGVVPTPEESWRVHNEAYALVAKCRRDWRDEVMGAAPIPGEWGSGELNSFADVVVVHSLPGKMKLTCNPHRRMELDGEADLVGCLRLSIVIERLKKLGWMEA